MEQSSKISMSPEIITEAEFMLQALFLGMILYFIYEMIKISRIVLPHGKISMGLEDVFYWLGNTYLIFKLLFKYNYGIIRWFVILGVGVGMLICKLTLGEWFEKKVSHVLSKILHFVKKVIFSIKKPLKRLEKNGDK